jgi:predicted homoserine dehydrogenase-like protein
MAGHLLRREVPAGTVMTAEMVEPPPDSGLWRLRREMEETFGLA